MTDAAVRPACCVIVIGSVNVDDTLECAVLAGPGETVLARTAYRRMGGKGGNQARAAARWGATTVLVARVGDDVDGRDARADLAQWGVRTDEVAVVGGLATGRAVVMVDDAGENAIVVLPGANAGLGVDDLDAALTRLLVTASDVMLTSGEIGADVVVAVAGHAATSGSVHVHNLAPAMDFPRAEMLTGVLVVNESEMRALSGEPTSEGGAAALAAGRRAAIVTLGGRGALLAVGADLVHVPVPAVQPVDTTGAGDALCGALAAELAQGAGLGEALAASVRGASQSVTAPGARGGLVSRAVALGEDEPEA